MLFISLQEASSDHAYSLLTDLYVLVNWIFRRDELARDERYDGVTYHTLLADVMINRRGESGDEDGDGYGNGLWNERYEHYGNTHGGGGPDALPF